MSDMTAVLARQVAMTLLIDAINTGGSFGRNVPLYTLRNQYSTIEDGSYGFKGMRLLVKHGYFKRDCGMYRMPTTKMIQIRRTPLCHLRT